jgi:hypothetical protein
MDTDKAGSISEAAGEEGDDGQKGSESEQDEHG